MARLVREAGLDDRIVVDSAGTGAYHVGERADPRACEAANARGTTLTSRARHFKVGDFARFDHVIAMDRENLDDLRILAPDADARARVSLLRSFDPAAPADLDVPDPYLGGRRGFDVVYDMCEVACRGLLEDLRVTHGLGSAP